MKPPERESGGMVSQTAASHELPIAKPKADVLGESVNLAQVGRWIDEAIAMCRKAATDPVEYQRLGIWLQRMRRAVG